MQPLVEILAVGHGHCSANLRNTATAVGARLRYVSHQARPRGRLGLAARGAARRGQRPGGAILPARPLDRCVRAGLDERSQPRGGARPPAGRVLADDCRPLRSRCAEGRGVGGGRQRVAGGVALVGPAGTRPCGPACVGSGGAPAPGLPGRPRARQSGHMVVRPAPADRRAACARRRQSRLAGRAPRSVAHRDGRAPRRRGAGSPRPRPARADRRRPRVAAHARAGPEVRFGTGVGRLDGRRLAGRRRRDDPTPANGAPTGACRRFCGLQRLHEHPHGRPDDRQGSCR